MLIDCPPALGGLTTAALAATDYVSAILKAGPDEVLDAPPPSPPRAAARPRRPGCRCPPSTARPRTAPFLDGHTVSARDCTSVGGSALARWVVLPAMEEALLRLLADIDPAPGAVLCWIVDGTWPPQPVRPHRGVAAPPPQTTHLLHSGPLIAIATSAAESRPTRPPLAGPAKLNAPSRPTTAVSRSKWSGSAASTPSAGRASCVICRPPACGGPGPVTADYPFDERAQTARTYRRVAYKRARSRKESPVTLERRAAKPPPRRSNRWPSSPRPVCDRRRRMPKRRQPDRHRLLPASTPTTAAARSP